MQVTGDRGPEPDDPSFRRVKKHWSVKNTAVTREEIHAGVHFLCRERGKSVSEKSVICQ